MEELNNRFELVLGRSRSMVSIFGVLRRVAPSTLSVLIEGETGTGKEAVARSIHLASERKDGPFVVLDCSAIPRELMESTLFGHERGAFTGAVAQRIGVFEQAHGGTLFLDEVGELDLHTQPSLLRVLETREVRRVGGEADIPFDVRIVAATNRDLRSMVSRSEFREDLFYRIAVVTVPLPPLRSRRDDIELLAEWFISEINEKRSALGESLVAMAEDVLPALRRRDWPGNVRQLKNVIERGISLADSSVLEVEDLDEHWVTGSHRIVSMDEGTGGETIEFKVDSGQAFKSVKAELLARFETVYLKKLLATHDNNISRAAKASGLTRFYLRELLKKRGLHPDGVDVEPKP